MCLNPDSHALNKGKVFGRGENLSAALKQGGPGS